MAIVAKIFSYIQMKILILMQKFYHLENITVKSKSYFKIKAYEFINCKLYMYQNIIQNYLSTFIKSVFIKLLELDSCPKIIHSYWYN